MQIGILLAGHVLAELEDEFGDYDYMMKDFLDGRGFTFKSWQAVDGEVPSSPQDADGWLITGSRHAVYEDHPWLDPLSAFVSDCYDVSVPIVGICFGHQLLAAALGGTVTNSKGGWNVGYQDYWIDGRRLGLNAWHQDQVVALPESAKIIGSNPTCQFAALEYPGKALSFQAHPEFKSRFLKELAERRGPGIVPDNILRMAKRNLGRPLDTDSIAERIASFYLEGR